MTAGLISVESRVGEKGELNVKDAGILCFTFCNSQEVNSMKHLRAAHLTHHILLS